MADNNKKKRTLLLDLIAKILNNGNLSSFFNFDVYSQG